MKNNRALGADTIFAVSSGAGRAAIAVIRLSGPATPYIIKSVAGRLPEPRRATLGTLKDPATGEPIDSGLVLYFPAPRSFTGEDCAEIHSHGGRAVVARLLETLGRFELTRPAEPGEFTRRAFAAGKVDLAEVEGLGDLIDAETESQRRQALRQMQGSLGRAAAAWRAPLLEAAALVEAEIDFSDEGDVPDALSRRISALVRPVLAALRAELAAGRAGERIREGITIVIAGPPNAGKSTLMNALARRDVAIVSQIAGTTRDAIEVHLDLRGYAATLIDTAGLRESGDEIEQAGVARTLDKARDADLVLWLGEAAQPTLPDAGLSTGTVWPVLTKSDLSGLQNSDSPGTLTISAETGENLDTLLTRLSDFAASASGAGHAGLITRERHRRAFAAASEALARIEAAPDAPVEILAEELRAALFALERLIGRVDVEDVLGAIFARFCIGK